MTYSISDLEQLSGISAHTIRIWERRYSALQPLRTSGNTRIYDDSQLTRLLNIAGLYHAGHKISAACAMESQQVSSFLQQEMDAKTRGGKFDYYVSQIIRNGLDFDERAVTDLLAASFAQHGIVATYRSVIYPVLVRTGLMWLNATICPSQEHFMSAIIRQKLFAAIDRLPVAPTAPGSGWLLFLPEDDDHDVGLLLSSYLLRAAGEAVTFLGSRVPLGALATAVTALRPKNLLCFMTRVRPVADAQAYVDRLAERFPDQHIYVSGNQKVLHEIACPPRVQWLQRLEELESLIAPSI